MNKCHVCTKDIGVYFWVDDELWKRVAAEAEDNMLCLDCFSIVAAAIGENLTEDDLRIVVPPGPVMRMWLRAGMKNNKEQHMRVGFEATNDNDADGNPAGGRVHGIGIDICWQNGPLGRGKDRVEPNGAFVEDVLDAVRQRLVYYQTAADGKFKCATNTGAITHIERALQCLDNRTREREERDVEGTHEA